MSLDDYLDGYFERLKKVFNLIKLDSLNKYLIIAKEPLKNMKLLESTIEIILTFLILNFILEKIPLLIKTIIIFITISPIFLSFGLPLFPSVIIIGLGLWVLSLIIEMAIILILGIYGLLEYLVAKSMKGKGDIFEHIKISYGSFLIIYILSLPLILISSILMILESLPLLDLLICLFFFPIFILQVIKTVLWVYGLYLKFIMLRKIHKFNSYETIITMIAPLYIIAFLLALFSFVVLIISYILYTIYIV
jgi:hypothetical protein